MKETFLMNANSKKLGIYFGIAVAVATASVTLRTIACLTHLNYFWGYFENKQLIGIADALIWCGVIFMLSYPVTSVKTALRPTFKGPSTYVMGGAVGAAAIFLCRALIEYSALKRDSNPETTPQMLAPLALATAVFCILSIGHFAANTFFSETKAEMRAALSIFTLLLLASYSALLYFENDLPLNAPNKLCSQMSFLFSALFFIYETRISLGREKWRAYATFGLMAFMLTAYSSVPALITYFAAGETISLFIEENVFALTLMLFIGARLLITVFLPEDRENKSVLAMKEAAQARRAEVTLTETRFAEAYAVQMSFDEMIDHDIALELEESFDEEGDPVSEAESPLDSDVPQTFFEEDILIDDESAAQISLGYDLLTPGGEGEPDVGDNNEDKE